MELFKLGIEPLFLT